MRRSYRGAISEKMIRRHPHVFGDEKGSLSTADEVLDAWEIRKAREREADAKAGRGWVDAYRALHPTGEDYTWWSNRGAARANNVGWRIDYQFVTPALRERLRACSIHRADRFSDHAPFTVDYAGPVA